MFYFQRLKEREIAEALEISENTVKSRLLYARRKLKDGVLGYEKDGVKLYSAAPWLIVAALGEGAATTAYPVFTVPAVAAAVAAEAVIGEAAADIAAETAGAAVNTAGEAATAANAAGTAETAVQAAGKGLAQAAGSGLIGKVIAGIAAVAVIGAAVFAVPKLLNKKAGAPSEEGVKTAEETVVDVADNAGDEVAEEPVKTAVTFFDPATMYETFDTMGVFRYVDPKGQSAAEPTRKTFESGTERFTCSWFSENMISDTFNFDYREDMSTFYCDVKDNSVDYSIEVRRYNDHTLVGVVKGSDIFTWNFDAEGHYMSGPGAFSDFNSIVDIVNTRVTPLTGLSVNDFIDVDAFVTAISE